MIDITRFAKFHTMIKYHIYNKALNIEYNV